MADSINKRIVLGSGKLYVTEFTSGSSIPADATIETDANLLGLISGGATLEYTPEFYTAEDDLGLVKRNYLTSEEVTFKSGILTWNASTLSKIVATGTLTDDTSGKTRTLKIGGLSNYDGKSYVIHFVHEDETDGDVRITLVGSNEAGFEMQFQKDSETVINAEFKAIPHDDDGTLVIYKEEYK